MPSRIADARLDSTGSDRTANRLAELISETPVRYLSEEAMAKMRLEISSLSDGPGIRRVSEADFLIALADLRSQANTLLDAAPTLRRPSHEDAHRRYFVVRTARYLRRKIGSRSNKVTAELAKIMLMDPEIDAEVVRKILS